MNNKLIFNTEDKLHNDENIMEEILKMRGIEHPEKFLYPEKFYQSELRTNPMDFHNMNKAINILENAFDKYETIGVLVDDDADGYSSSAALIHYIGKIRGSLKEIEWFFHTAKSHGLTNEIFKQLYESDCDLIIIPDAASNDFEYQRKLLEIGKKIIILDHHEVDNQEEITKLEDEFENYALVNNQLTFNKDTNKHFVGGGMVYKFCEAFDLKHGFDYSNEIIDLVALGQIGDASDISDYEIRFLVNHGLKNIQSPIMKITLKDKIDEGKVAPINLSFSIIPMVNAVSRVGTLEEKDLMLKALLGYWTDEERILVTKRRKNKITGKFAQVELEWTMYEYVADELAKIKNRQNKNADKIQKQLIEDAFTNKICIATTTEEDIQYRSITGLIGNKLMSKFKMPTLVLVENEDGNFSGSGRGYEKTFKDFRQWCNDTGMFELAQGHDNAFGVEIKKENLEKLKEKLMSDDSLGSDKEIVYDVDKLYVNETNLNEIELINDNQEIFGGKVQAPVFGYKDLVINRNSINQRGSVVTFFHKGLEFIAYKQEVGVVDDFVNSLGFQQEFTVDLVGSPSRNNWNGRIKEQVVLDDFALRVEVETKEENTWMSEDGELSF